MNVNVIVEFPLAAGREPWGVVIEIVLEKQSRLARSGIIIIRGGVIVVGPAVIVIGAGVIIGIVVVFIVIRVVIVCRIVVNGFVPIQIEDAFPVIGIGFVAGSDEEKKDQYHKEKQQS
jgi:hypothetical protein